MKDLVQISLNLPRVIAFFFGGGGYIAQARSFRFLGRGIFLERARWLYIVHGTLCALCRKMQ